MPNEQREVKELSSEERKEAYELYQKAKRDTTPLYKIELSRIEEQLLDHLLFEGGGSINRVSTAVHREWKTVEAALKRLEEKKLIIESHSREKRRYPERRVNLRKEEYLKICSDVKLVRLGERMVAEEKIDFLKDRSLSDVLIMYFDSLKPFLGRVNDDARQFLKILLTCKELGIDYFGKLPKTYSAFEYRRVRPKQLIRRGKIPIQFQPKQPAYWCGEFPLQLLVEDFRDTYQAYQIDTYWNHQRSIVKRRSSFKRFWLKRELRYYPELNKSNRSKLFNLLEKFVNMRDLNLSSGNT